MRSEGINRPNLSAKVQVFQSVENIDWDWVMEDMLIGRDVF